MRKYKWIFLAVLLLCLPTMQVLAQSAEYDAYTNPPLLGWGFALRGGGSFPTGDFINNVDSDPGILINSQVFYTINRGWNMGVMASWERHKLDALGTDIGKLETISILPFIEFHYRAGRWSPYLSFGIGMNFNALKEDSNVPSFCNSFGVGSCDVDVDNTLALRVGGGTDFFLTDNLAINVEGAWKKNSGDFDVKVAGSNQGSGKFKGHVAQGMVGLKYYFQ